MFFCISVDLTEDGEGKGVWLGHVGGAKYGMLGWRSVAFDNGGVASGFTFFCILEGWVK